MPCARIPVHLTTALPALAGFLNPYRLHIPPRWNRHVPAERARCRGGLSKRKLSQSPTRALEKASGLAAWTLLGYEPLGLAPCVR